MANVYFKMHQVSEKPEASTLGKQIPCHITFLSPIIEGSGTKKALPFTTFLVNMWDATREDQEVGY